MVIAAAFGIVWVGYRLSTVTIPLLLALALAYLFEPVVRRLTRRGRVSRQFVAILIIVVATVAIVVPASVGGAFAVIQGGKLAQRLTRNVDALAYSIQHPDDEESREQVAILGNSWLRIRDYVIQQEANLRSWRAAREEQVEAVVPPPNETVPPQDGPPPANTPSESPHLHPSDAHPAPHPLSPADDAPPVAANPQTDPTGAQIALVIAPEPSDLYRLIQWTSNWVRENAASLGKGALNVSGGVAGAAVSTLSSFGAFLFGAFLTAFFFFFFCTGYGRVISFWESLIPERRKYRAFELLAKMDQVIAGFVRGRLTICVIMICVYTLGFWLMGVPAPLIAGPVVGLLTIVPYASGALGIPLAMLLMWIEPAQGFRSEWWWIVASPLALTGIVQFLDDYILTPRIQGKSTNMDTPTILFASIAGGVLAGFYGILLAIPVAACIKILVKEIVWPRFQDWSHGRAKDVLPIGKE